MSKRLNPHRRLLAAQAKLLNEQRLLQSAIYGVEGAMLQQGRVRSPLTTIYRGQVPPHMASWEPRGKRGKVVDGRFKPVNPATVQRFAQK